MIYKQYVLLKIKSKSRQKICKSIRVLNIFYCPHHQHHNNYYHYHYDYCQHHLNNTVEISEPFVTPSSFQSSSCYYYYLWYL